MQLTDEKQTCSKCEEEKPLSAFRRHSHRPNGRDAICKVCRKKAYYATKEEWFGPLPEPEGSDEWVEEIWRRAAVIRAEKEP